MTEIRNSLNTLATAIESLQNAPIPEPTILDRQLSGNKINGGSITSFASTGITDRATSKILEYYEKRAKNNLGLIITEGIIIHPSGDGYNNVPHLFTNEQMLSWKKVVDGVHKYKTKIYAQLWHCGRISHIDYTNGFDLISSTSSPAKGLI